jgi:hypothetical protein
MSEKLASSSAFNLKSGWMRSPAGVRRQVCKASVAAFTARATSAAEDNGASARTSPVAGLVTGMISVADDVSQRPPM